MQVFRAYSFDADDNSFYVPMSQIDCTRRLQAYMTWSLWNHFTASLMFRRLLTPSSFATPDWRVATSYQNTATSDETSVGQQQVDDQVRVSVAVGFVERATAFPLLTSVAYSEYAVVTTSIRLQPDDRLTKVVKVALTNIAVRLTYLFN